MENRNENVSPLFINQKYFFVYDLRSTKKKELLSHLKVLGLGALTFDQVSKP